MNLSLFVNKIKLTKTKQKNTDKKRRIFAKFSILNNFKNKKVFIVPNAKIKRKVFPIVKLTSELKINAFNSKKKIKFLTIARLNWVKGLDFTLEALALLKAKGIDFQYTIIGFGVELERLIFATNQLGLNENVIFLGSVVHSDIYKFYNNTDIYLQYSLNEGFCNSVIESQSMGLLTIVSENGGLPENVIHEKTGWIVKKNSPKKLAEMIKIVLDKSNEDLLKIRLNAINHVKKNFCLEKQSNKFEKFFN